MKPSHSVQHGCSDQQRCTSTHASTWKQLRLLLLLPRGSNPSFSNANGCSQNGCADGDRSALAGVSESAITVIPVLSLSGTECWCWVLSEFKWLLAQA